MTGDIQDKSSLENKSNAIVSFHNVKGREQQTDFNYVATTATIAS
jgi:hypothetical protein